MIAREERGMRCLDNGMFCVLDVFGVQIPIKREALIIWHLVAQWIIFTYGDNKGA